MRSFPSEAACIGKVPTHGDFVRHRASTPTMRAFDKWIRKGLRRIRRGSASSWNDAYEHAPPVRFFLSSRDQKVPNVLLGVLRASHDRNERTYPFTVTCELPKSTVRTDQLAHLPSQATSFYTAAERVVTDAVGGSLSHHEVIDRVAEIDPSPTPPSPSTYNQFVQEETVGGLLEAVFGDFEDGGKYRLFKNILDVLLPQRTRTAPRLNYGLQFPLGTGPLSPTKAACFWLDTSLRLLDCPGVECSFFWTPEPPDSMSSFLLLFLGSPQADGLFHLLRGDGETENIFALDRAGGEDDAEAALSIPDEYGSLLEDDQLPLRDFLRGL